MKILAIVITREIVASRYCSAARVRRTLQTPQRVIYIELIRVTERNIMARRIVIILLTCREGEGEGGRGAGGGSGEGVLRRRSLGPINLP